MENLYFIALTPPEEISGDIIKIQEDIAVRFESKTSLKVMPHITLKAPFRIPALVHGIILEWFQNLTIGVASFNLKLNGYGAFHNKNNPVLFIKPVSNVSLLTLQKQILTQFEKAFQTIPISNLEINFHPHLTVAYRDLKVNFFEEAWREFKEKEFKKTFEVKHFHLLQHNGKKWIIISSSTLL